MSNLTEYSEIEDVLKGLLQKNVRLNIKTKQYRKGKLILFRQTNYHIELTICKTNKETKRFEIPIPFGIEEWKDEGLVYFDYRLMTLSHNNKEICNMLETLPLEGNNKFYNNILEIKVIKEEENG